jgi:outer membrane lipoprotein-sorting protein
MRTRALWIAAAVWLLAAPTPPAQDESLCRRALQELNEGYRTFRSVKARFRHALVAHALKQEELEEGNLILARGGKMRWEYTRPAGKLAVTDGRTSYLYLPSEKQVYVQPMDQWENPLAMRLLSGQVRPDQEVRCLSAAKTGDETVLRLELVAPDTGIKDLEVTLSQALGIVTGVRFRDPLGNSVTFELSHVETGGDFPEALFTFQVPPGVQVLGGTP